MSRRLGQHSLHLLLAASIGVLIVVSACSRSPEPARVQPTPDPIVQRDTPIGAARATLSLLRQHLAALIAGEEERAQERLDQVVWHLAAREKIVNRFRANPMANLQKSDLDVLTMLVESWAALLAHYANDLQLDQLAVETEGINGAAVRAPASHADDNTSVMLALVPSDDEWYVLAIDFAAPMKSPTQPAAE